MARINQGQWIRRKLLAGGRLNHLDLIQECKGRGGWRTAAYVHQLRKEGWPVLSVVLPTSNENWFGAPVAYYLKPGWRPDGSTQLELTL